MTVYQVQRFWLCPAVCCEQEPPVSHTDWLVSAPGSCIFNGLEFTMSVWCLDHSDLGSGSPFSQFLCLCDLGTAPPSPGVQLFSAQTVSPLEWDSILDWDVGLVGSQPWRVTPSRPSRQRQGDSFAPLFPFPSLFEIIWCFSFFRLKFSLFFLFIF